MKRLIRCLSIVVLSTMSMMAGADTTPSPPSSSPVVMRLLEEGSRYYIQRQFKRAIGPYAKVLELEKQQATMGTPWMRVLIDNLGMAYGMTGDLEKAKATFEYGLSKDDTYPMFYYNLACTYAEMQDLEGTLANLKLAIQYKDNMMENEVFPDPAEDSSFQRYVKDERFVKLMQELRAAR